MLDCLAPCEVYAFASWTSLCLTGLALNMYNKHICTYTYIYIYKSIDSYVDMWVCKRLEYQVSNGVD